MVKRWAGWRAICIASFNVAPSLVEKRDEGMTQAMGVLG
jgi:hypothetical protein